MPNPSCSFSIEIDCPWCSKSVDFHCREVFDWKPSSGMEIPDFAGRDGMQSPINHRAPSNDRGPFFKRRDAKDLANAYGFGACPKCRRPVILAFHTSLRDLRQLISADPQSPMAKSLFASSYLKLVETVPQAETQKTPDHVPDVVKELWPHTLTALQRGDPPSRVVTECRSILDVCLKDLGADKGTRKDRIKMLLDKHILTADLASWGEVLWSDGNDAVHDIKADQAQARKHVEFLQLFFQVAYNLRDQVKQHMATKSGAVSP